MRQIGSLLCSTLLCAAAAGAAHAGIVTAPGADLAVSLITYGPGDVYWERFGHDAIEIRDRVSGQAVSFNYGVFDFDERGFLLNFARGYMHYMIDAEPTGADERFYRDSGRSIASQRLRLSAAQAAKLRDFLLWNLQPQNAGYNYDYLLDNCATRVRDALDRVLGGALRKALSARPGAMTYRQQIDRLTSGQAWMMLALDLGMGPSADRALNAWQESFLPMVLQRQLRAVRIADAGGGFAPLVLRERRVAPNRLEPPPQQPPDLRIPLALAGLAYAALILALRRRAPRAYALAAGAFLAAAGFIGVLLACLWTLTMHRIAWDNANLLLFNPLAFALLPAVWRARRGGGLGASSRALLGLQLAAVLLAALLHLLPDGVQQNQPWLLFAICCWGALAYSFRGAANFRGAPA